MIDNEVMTTKSESIERLRLNWRRLSYKANDKKTILNEVNGEIISGQLTGILGPSGSGKTTLIECLAGKRKAGLSGKVWVKSVNNGKPKPLRIAYNAQSDALLDELTVEEALQYASELKKIRSKRYDFFDTNNRNGKIHYKNGNTSDTNGIDIITEEETPLADQQFSHQINVDNMIQAFGLSTCAQVRTSSISGGQKKRLSIALELIFSPNILLLDEPTTGLDSVSSFQCLSLLKTLSFNKEPLVIAASIHQPTARLLSFFDCIIVLSIEGNCIYSGPTDKLIAHLYGYGLICPIYHNPADYVIEIASGGHGKESIDILSVNERQKYGQNVCQILKHELIQPNEECNRSLKDQLIDVCILVRRSSIIAIRNPILIWIRLLAAFFSLAGKYVIYSNVNAGDGDGGCTDATAVFNKIRSIVTNESSIQKNFKNLQNVSYIITLTMFVHFCTVCPTLMTFPTELATYVKEHFNKWYTCWSYFTSKSIVDLPAIVLIPVIYASILWVITDQPWDLFRFSIHLVVIILLSLVSHSLGLLLSAFFINNIKASLLSFSIFVTPFLLFSGYLIPIRVIPEFLQGFSYLSIFRLSYESMLIIIYGFGRCPRHITPLTFNDLNREFDVNVNQINECLEWADSLTNLTHNGLNAFNRILVKQHPSRMLDYFDLKESDLYVYISLLLVYTIVLRALAYYALKWRVKIK